MSGLAATKICGICGEDCSNKARTKDANGRYFCKGCYDVAARQKKPPAQRSVAPNTVAANPLDAVLDSLPKSPAASVCAACRTTMPAGAVICLACGYNASTGSSINVAVKKAPRAPILNGWLAPLIAGGVLATAALVCGFAARGDTSRLGMFALATVLVWAVYYVWMIVDARRGEGQQFLIYVIPLYFLFYIFSGSKSRYLRALTPGVLIAAGMLVFLALDSDKNPPPKVDPNYVPAGAYQRARATTQP